MKIHSITLLALIFLAIQSCKEKPAPPPPPPVENPVQNSTEPEIRMEQAISDINKYVSEQKLDTQMTETGIVYTFLKRNPKGRMIHSFDKAEVKYRGTTLDGQVFDEGVFTLTVSAKEVIPGWDEGLLLMREGEKAKMILPFWQAYGEQSPSPKIPPYATLVFEMEVLKLTPGKNE